MADQPKTPAEGADAAAKTEGPRDLTAADQRPAPAETAQPKPATPGKPTAGTGPDPEPAAVASAAEATGAPAAAPTAPAMPKPPAAAKPAAPAAPAPNLAGKTTTAAAAATKPAGKPGAGGDDTSPLMSRRAWIGLSWGAFAAASAAALAATGRFMFPNVLNEPPQQFKAGFPNEYGMGVDERWKEKFGIWIVRVADEPVEPHGSGF